MHCACGEGDGLHNYETSAGKFQRFSTAITSQGASIKRGACAVGRLGLFCKTISANLEASVSSWEPRNLHDMHVCRFVFLRLCHVFCKVPLLAGF